MLNKATHKTRHECMRKKEKRRSIHGDNTNILAKEFKPFAIKRFGEQVILLIISVNEFKSERTIFDKLPNEVMSNLYVFSLRMLNRVLRDVNGTGIVTVDSEMFLTNTVIVKKFFASIEVGCNSYQQQCTQPLQWIMRWNSAFCSSRRQD